MKQIYFLLALLCTFFATSCSSDEEVTIDKALIGEWQLIQWGDQAAVPFEAYIEFQSDGRFTLYQRIETSVFTKYNGSYCICDGVLSGIYEDGTSLGAEYAFSISNDRLMLTSKSNTPETSVYKKTKIPEEVRNAPTVCILRVAPMRIL